MPFTNDRARDKLAAGSAESSWHRRSSELKKDCDFPLPVLNWKDSLDLTGNGNC